MPKQKPEPCPECGKTTTGECYGRVFCPRRRQQTAGIADDRTPIFGTSGCFRTTVKLNRDS